MSHFATLMLINNMRRSGHNYSLLFYFSSFFLGACSGGEKGERNITISEQN